MTLFFMWNKGNERRVVALIFVLAAVLDAGAAFAGLSGPPSSYFIPTRDGTHLFVMLSPAPLANDSGNARTLPNGKSINLREYFPASGLYRNDSTDPIWTADWYGEHWLVRLSEDGRYAVLVNQFGDGGFGQSKFSSLSWGIRFFDRGKQISIHHVQDLVDYPSLMPFTSADWHYVWFDWDLHNSDIHNGKWSLATSTHERYQFDVTTGRIVKEYRLWRTIARGGLLLLVCCAMIGGFVTLHRLKARRNSAPRICVDLEHPAEIVTPSRGYSFSLRFLLFVVATTAVLCAVFRAAPHIGVLLTGVFPAALLTRRLSTRNRSVNSVSTRGARLSRRILWTSTVGAWILLYFLSLGPALWLADEFDLPNDFRVVVWKTVYCPVFWLCMNTPLCDCVLLARYFESWGPFFVWA
jgi:hypothetical protein